MVRSATLDIVTIIVKIIGLQVAPQMQIYKVRTLYEEEMRGFIHDTRTTTH